MSPTNSVTSPLTSPPARCAFDDMDPQLSKALHQQRLDRLTKRDDDNTSEGDDDHHTEFHSAIGELLKSVVFGGLDGIMTTFAIVAACIGAKMTYKVLLIVGVSNLIADGFAMGLGDFFSSYSETGMAKKLYKKYVKRIQKDQAEEKKKMREIYEEKGFSQEECKIIVDHLAMNQSTFAKIMLLEKDGVALEDSSIWEPMKSGFVTFLAFLIFGILPIIPFVFTKDFEEATKALNYHFFVSLGLSGVALFALGFGKNLLVSKNPWVGGLFVTLQGGLTNLLSYGIGWLLEDFIGSRLE